MNTFNPKTDCCPEFNPIPWDGKTFEWKNKKFIKDKVFTFMHMPMNFGSVVSRMNKKIESAGSTCKDFMALSDHTSSWNMNLYMAVEKEIPDAENVQLSGKFLSKVYEGPFQNTGKWCKDFENYASQQGFSEIKKWYMWYTTCPKCAKKYGKNYVAIIGQVA